MVNDSKINEQANNELLSDLIVEKLLMRLHEGYQSDTIKIVISTANGVKLKGKVAEVKAFQWIEKKIEIDQLYNILVDEKIVEAGDVVNFRKAFSGKVITKDNHLITWLPLASGGPNKKELFYFLYVLGNKELIANAIPTEKDGTELYERIRRVFADSKGVSIVKGIRQSFLDFNRERKSNLPAKLFKKFSKTEPREVVRDFGKEMTKSILKKHDKPDESLRELNKLLNPPAQKYEHKYELIVQKVRTGE